MSLVTIAVVTALDQATLPVVPVMLVLFCGTESALRTVRLDMPRFKSFQLPILTSIVKPVLRTVKSATTQPTMVSVAPSALELCT